MFDSITDAFKDFSSEYYLPLLLGGQAASVLMRQSAERKARQRQDAMLNAEQERQAGIAARARQAFQNVMPQMTPQAIEARRAAEEAKMADFVRPPSQPSSVLDNYQQTMAQNQPALVSGDLTSKVGAAMSEAQANAQRLALAKSFGLAQQGANRDLASAGREISRAGRDARASANILPYEMAEAGQSGNRLRFLSDAVGAGTGIAGLYGATVAQQRKRPAPDRGLTRDSAFYGGSV